MVCEDRYTTCRSSYRVPDVIKDFLYLTMLMCSILSPEMLNPDVLCMFSLVLLKYHPQIPLVGLNLTRTALRHTYQQLGYRTPIPRDDTIN